MLQFLYDVIGKLWSRPLISDTNQTLEDEWVVLLSEDEVRFSKFSEHHQNAVASELAALRKNNSQQHKITILGKLNETFMHYDLSAIETVKLSSDLRGKIYKDVFNKLSSTWLQEIQEICIESSVLKDNWTPSMYQKNILGQMIDMADRTSPETLNVMGLVQTIKNVHLCLYQELQALNISVNSNQSEKLLEIIMKMIIPVIELWCITVKNTQGSINKQGQLPKKWAQEAAVTRQHLADLKRTHSIDHKYAEGSLDPVRQNYLNEKHTHQELLMNQNTLKARQEQLRRHFIHQRHSTKVTIEPCTNFKQVQSNLATLLHFQKHK